MPSEGFPSLRKSAGGVAQLRYFWPMVVMVVMLALMLLSTSIKFTNNASPALHTQQLSQTMQQLSSNQAAMMQVLQQLATNKSALPEQHQQQVTKNQAEMMQLLQQLAATNKNAPAEELSKKQAEMLQMLQQLAASKSTPADQQQKPQQQQKPEQQQQQQQKAPDKPDGEELPAAFAAIPKLTTLHNQLLRSSHSYEQHRTTMKATLDRLVHLPPADALALINTQLKQQSGKHAEAFTYRLYKLLLSSEKLIPCREDSTLVVNDPHFSATPVSTSSHPAHPHFSLHMPHFWQQHTNQASARSAAASAPHPRYYFATNLRDNSVNMPQYILSLLQTLLQLPQDHVFVSAYESNSDDGAHGWIDVLQLALNVIGTPSRLVTRGMLVRLEGTYRIEFLARVRNMALAPLYQRYATERSKQGANTTTATTNVSSSTAGISSSGRRSVLAESGSSSSSSFGSGPFSEGSERRRRLRAAGQLESLAAVDDTANLLPGVLPWDPDYIVFVNDVYFCASQVLRLMNYQADITCGMDYWQNRGGGYGRVGVVVPGQGDMAVHASPQRSLPT
jgi:chemotaxis protein histidine kinase CheA